MGETSNITVEQHDGMLHAVMHNPPGNELELPFVTELRAVIDEFERGSAKVFVLSSGIPGAFASGLRPARSEDPSVQELADYRDALCDALEALARSRRPSIAVIDGSALGGGLELAMACTLRFASPTSRLGLPEVKLGTIPSGGGTQRLPHLIGRGRALELMLSGREIELDEAARIGLVDRVLDGDIVREALAIAAGLADSSAQAMAAIMLCVDAARDLPHEDGIAVERVALQSTFEPG
jgi:enoyl-CoA hydratase/carnithine racemase